MVEDDWGGESIEIRYGRVFVTYQTAIDPFT